jgi:hypothetical protein
MAEGLDLSGKNASGDAAAKRARGRPSSEQKHRELRTDLKASIEELADWLGETEQQDEPATLGDLIKRNADQMADVLAAWAEKSGTIEKLLRRLVGKGGPLSALRAFGPVARRLVLEPLRARAAYPEEEPLPEDQPDGDAGFAAFT